MSDFLHLDFVAIIKTLGYAGLFTVIFAESGLIIGFFLPGASLLFTAGLLASQGFFNIYALVITLGLAAILGDSTGYWFGTKVGPKLFTREDSRFFKKKHLKQAHDFYEKYGPRAVVIGRFVPIIRTFVPILAGIAEMPYGKFLRYNIIGGILWSVGVSLLGFFLGASFPQVQEYLIPIVLIIIVLTTLPIFWELWKKKR